MNNYSNNYGINTHYTFNPGNYAPSNSYTDNARQYLSNAIDRELRDFYQR